MTNLITLEATIALLRHCKQDDAARTLDGVFNLLVKMMDADADHNCSGRQRFLDLVSGLTGAGAREAELITAAWQVCQLSR